MPSRVSVLGDLIKFLRQEGYQFITVRSLAEIKAAGGELPPRTAVIRCDVDSDVRTSLDMARVCSDLDIVGSWYWRLSTLDKAALTEVAQSGHENGYHFEELATVAKRRGIRHASDALRILPEIREEFCRNLEDRYLPAAQCAPKTVASHGDFANRLLKQTNSVIVDSNIRSRYGIIAETYDKWLNTSVTRRYSDAGPPSWWTPGSPFVQPPKTRDLVYVLVHPRHYAARWGENTFLDLERLFEGGLHSMRTAAWSRNGLRRASRNK
jgi:hypothetical protein